MPLANITDLENAIKRTELQSSNLFMSSFTPEEVNELKYIYSWQIIVYKKALVRLKSANDLEVINPETIQ